MADIDRRDIERLGLAAAAQPIHRDSLIVDLHVDSIIQQRLFDYDLLVSHSADQSLGKIPAAIRGVYGLLGLHRPLFGHADVPRMCRAGYSCAAFGLHYWPWQSENGWREIQNQLDYYHLLLQNDAPNHPSITQAKTPQDIGLASRNRLATFVGVEGLHCLGAGGRKNDTRRLDRIETLFEQGVRYITLAHFCRNDAATHTFGPGSNDEEGLTSFGRAVIGKMNEVGMIVDLAHVNNRGVLDACEISQQPVVATHTSLRGAIPQYSSYRRRGVSDEGLRAIATTGGVVGLIMAPHFLCGGPAGTGAVADQLRYGFERLAKSGFSGEDHFAFGSDFDGWIPAIPNDIEDVADMPRLTETLLGADFTAPQIKKFWGLNFLRVWQQVLKR